jgi:GT2 family glycosyltransferase
LRAALAELLEDPQLWLRCRAAGLAQANRYTWTRIAEQQAELYAEATGSQLSGPADSARGIQVLIVAYGSPELLRSCLQPLEGRLPVTVVDNSSSAQTRELVEAAGAHYVDAGANLGFAAGVNLGLRSIDAPGEDILLLNPDAAISWPDVQALQRRLWSDPRLAAVAPSQIDPRDGQPGRVSWPFPSPAGMWIESIGLGRLRRRPDFVIGSVLLIKADALADVGELDERFFLYAEEIDWQLRARARGWRTLEVTAITAQHEGAGTGGDPAARETFFHASHELLIRKHYRSGGWFLYRLAVILGSGGRAVALSGHRRRLAANRLRLYLRGPLRAQRSTGRK